MTLPLNSVPGSSRRGTLYEIYGQTKTHGTIQLPIIQEFTMDPKFTTASLGEFATNNDVLTTQSYKNEEISFKMFETDLVTLYNVMMDLPPALSSQTPIAVLREQMYSVFFNMYGNVFHQFTAGTRFQGFLAINCRVQSITDASPIDGDATVTVKVMASWGTMTKAGAILYSRMVGSAPAYSSTGVQPADLTFTGHVAYLTRSVVTLPLPGTGGSTQIDLATFKNGLRIFPTQTGPISVAGSLYNINYGNQFNVTAAIGSTDVYENYAVYSSTVANP